MLLNVEGIFLTVLLNIGHHCSRHVQRFPLEESTSASLPLTTLRRLTNPSLGYKIYIAAQLLGGIVGAAVVYANYFHAINLFEGHGVRTQATASLFSTYAVSFIKNFCASHDSKSSQLDYMTNVSCFFSEFLGTMVLLFVVLAIGDKKNSPPPSGLAPLVLFILILGIGTSLGMQTGAHFIVSLHHLF